MRMLFSGAVSIFALKVLTVPLCAEGALAEGLPEGDPRNGFAYHLVTDKPSGGSASIAVSKCKTENDRKDTSRARATCKLIETFQNACANIALNGNLERPSTAVGWGFGPDKKTADARAMAQCEAMRKGKGRECIPDGEPLCDGIAKKE